MMTVSFSLMGMDAGPDAGRYLVFAAIFDGLFVFHYFVETMIWRFGDPYFRTPLPLASMSMMPSGPSPSGYSLRVSPMCLSASSKDQ